MRFPRIFSSKQDPDDWHDQAIDREREERDRQDANAAEKTLERKEVFDRVVKQIFEP